MKYLKTSAINYHKSYLKMSKDTLDLASIVLYGFLLDILELSKKNNWINDIFNIYKRRSKKNV